MTGLSISLILLLIARLVSVDCSSETHGYDDASTPSNVKMRPRSVSSLLGVQWRQGRSETDSSLLTTLNPFTDNNRQDDLPSKLFTSSSSNVAGVISSKEPTQQHRSLSTLRGLATEATVTTYGGGIDNEDSVYETTSPRRSPWAVVVSTIQNPAATPTDDSRTLVSSTADPNAAMMAPVVSYPSPTVSVAQSSPLASPISAPPTALSPGFTNTETLPLNNFEISIRAKVAVDSSLYGEQATIHVLRVNIRMATEDYLKETLPYENLRDVQLYSLERRYRNLLEKNDSSIVESFRYEGEAVFHNGAVPDRSNLLEEQQRALNDTEAFQDYIHKYNADTLGNVELIGTHIIQGAEDRAVDTGNDEQRVAVSLIAVIAVAVVVSLVILLLNIAMVYKLCRQVQHHDPPPTPPTHIISSNEGKEEGLNSSV